MAAGVLRNLRFITKNQFDQMDKTTATASFISLKHALGLSDHHVESGRESLRSRLSALSVECLNRGLISHEKFDEAVALAELAEDQRQVLLSQVTTKMRRVKVET